MKCSGLNAHWRLKFVILFFTGLFLYSCAAYHTGAIQPKGIYHRIKSGDTLWSIARAYRVNIQDLAEVNNITDPNLIEVDNVIFVPDVNYIVDDVMTSVDTAGLDEGRAQSDNVPSPVIPAKKEAETEKTSPKLEKPPVGALPIPKDQQKLSVKTEVKRHDVPSPVVPAKKEAEAEKTSPESKKPPVRDLLKDQQKLSVKTDVKRHNVPSPVIPAKKEAEAEKTSPKLEKPPARDLLKDQQKLSVKTAASGRDVAVSTHAKSESQNATGPDNRKEVSRVDGKASISQDIIQKDKDGDSEKIRFDRGRFIWPVKGKVRSKFGIQPNGMYSNGIRISAKEGKPVLAAAGGTVIKSTLLKCCGETIIIKHEDNYATVYTDLGSRMVKEDDQVKKGSRIALPAKSDRLVDAYVHFEIRHKNKARNPLFFLP